MRKLERFLVDKPPMVRRTVVALHGLGGIGKTQLAVEFARKHQRRFSAIFWLDGSSEANLKQSFVDMAQRLLQDKLTADSMEALKYSSINIDMAVRECLRWLSLPSNHHWLLIFDNTDRDHHDKDDSQAHNVNGYF